MAKRERNEKILADFLAGMSVYAIANEHKISWTRAKAILNQMGVFSRNVISLEEAEKRRKVAVSAGLFCRKNNIKPLHCQVCGTFQKIEKHHVDYDNPNLVIFLCRKHHHIFHEADRNLLDGIEPVDLIKLVEERQTACEESQ